MIRTEVYIPENIKPLILNRTKKLGINVSEYFRMLALEDISKEQLKAVRLKEEKLLEDIDLIKNKLNNNVENI